MNNNRNRVDNQKPYGFSDIRAFIDYLKLKDDLIVIDRKIDPILEINAILDRLPRIDGPAVLFTDVKGSEYPVLGNAFGADRRISLAFGCNDFAKLVKDRARSISLIMTDRNKDILLSLRAEGIINKFKNFRKALKAIDWRKSLTEIKGITSTLPIKVKRSKVPCKEIILSGDDIDLDKFPLIKCWPKDGGSYITLPLVITRDPETRSLNIGIYRMMQLDKKRLCIHWLPQKHGNMHYSKAQKLGQEFPVVVAIGADPALEISGAFQLMPPIDEFMIAGLLKGKGIKYAEADDSDIWIPASAEIIFEGIIQPNLLADEGPFGEFNGYYSPVKQTPVFEVKKITMRKNAIWHAASTGMPKTEIHFISKAMERIALELAKVFYPSLEDLNLTVESGSLYTLIASIKKNRIYEAQEIMHFLWSFAAQSPYITNIIVVDNDVNVHDLESVFIAVAKNMRPEYDITITQPGLTDLEKPSIYPRGIGSRMGIDATAKWPEEGEIPVSKDRISYNEESDSIKGQLKEYRENLTDLHIVPSGKSINIIASTKNEKSFEARKAIQHIWRIASNSKAVVNTIIVDENIDVRNINKIFWAFSMQVRPEKDVYLVHKDFPNSPKPSAGIGLDATTKKIGEEYDRKKPELIKMDEDIEKKANEILEEIGL